MGSDYECEVLERVKRNDFMRGVEIFYEEHSENDNISRDTIREIAAKSAGFRDDLMILARLEHLDEIQEAAVEDDDFYYRIAAIYADYIEQQANSEAEYE